MLSTLILILPGWLRRRRCPIWNWARSRGRRAPWGPSGRRNVTVPVSDRTREQPPGTNSSLCAVTQVEERKRKWVKKTKKAKRKKKTQYTHIHNEKEQNLVAVQVNRGRIVMIWMFTFVRIDRPRFGFVEMGISSVNGEIGVGQSATCAVKGIAVSVFSRLKTVGK